MKKHVFSAFAALSAAALLAGCGASGGDGNSNSSGGGSFEPEGDVTMIVPFAAGGGSDQAGRMTAAAIESVADGVNVNVENRDGGSGAVGYAYFLSRKGDPETLLATETALLAVPLTQDVNFTYQDFTPIMKLADDYTLMVAKQDAPYSDCKDVVEASKSSRVVAGISGQAGLDNIVFTLTERQTGAKFDRVPFESGGELTTALLGGEVDVASLNPSEIMGQIKAKKVKALCAFAEERYDYPELKDIPTAKEQGIDVAFAQFRGVLAPGDISDEAKQYWIDVMEKALDSKEYQDWLKAGLLQAQTLAGDDFTKYLEESNAKLEQVLKG